MGCSPDRLLELLGQDRYRSARGAVCTAASAAAGTPDQKETGLEDRLVDCGGRVVLGGGVHEYEYADPLTLDSAGDPLRAAAKFVRRARFSGGDAFERLEAIAAGLFYGLLALNIRSWSVK